MEEILFKYKNQHKPEKGCLLISEPHLPDNNFDRSVIYLCEHNDKGSFGLVLNKTSEYKLHDLISLPPIQKKEEHFKIGVGGPVEYNTLHFLYRNNPTIEDSISVGNNINWGGDYEQVINWVQSDGVAKDIQFFIGYSGWSEGQLEEEVERNSWIVFPNASEQLVFDTRKKNLWKDALNELGGRYSVFANYPSDPRLN
jgi:putative transcriptional regulator